MARRGAEASGFTQSTRAEGASAALVIVLHGWHALVASLADVIGAVRQAYGPDAVPDILAPELPYRSLFDASRGADLVAALLARVDRVVADHGPYDQIVLIGHSMGATLARRLFLAAHGPLAEFKAEAPLDREPARAWAKRVSRIVLLGAINRGWQISERMSWSYTMLFNAVGFIGHLAPTRAWTPSAFDFRLGAPFMVQTRLNWLAYRRHSDRDRTGPLLVQLIGSRDDLVSPFDQVDIAVDGLERDVRAQGGRRVRNAGSRSFYLLELPDTGHADAIDFTGPLGATPEQDADARAAARRRQQIFIQALRDGRPELHRAALDPDLLADAVEKPDAAVRHAVFVIHGIRDDGFWTHRIAERIRARHASSGRPGAAIRAWTPSYGYFAMLPFMLPWVRQNKVEWLMDGYVDACACYPEAVFDYVGHSNGTYLGARALRDYADCRFRHVFFAGSVVRRDFDWAGLVAAGRVERILNVVATADWVVALLPKSVEWFRQIDLGGAGFDGFADAANLGELGECRYVAGDHGAGIVEGHWDDIAAFVTDGTALVPDPGRPLLFGARQSPWLRRLADLRLTLPVLAFAFVVGVPALVIHAAWGAPISLMLLILLLYALAVGFVVNRV